MKTTRTLIAALTLLAPVAARATNAPHDASTIPNATGCQDCHMMHFASGSALTNQPDNFTVCTHCHNGLSAGFSFGGAWSTSDQATPGAGGHSHHWSGSTTNATFGASQPSSASLTPYTPNGTLQCSTCHDPHAAGAANAPRNQHVSVERNKALSPAGGGTGGTMTLAVGAAAVTQGYRIQIGPSDTAHFQVSHDANAKDASTITWPTTYAIPGGGGAVALTGTGDDPNVSVSFGGTLAVGTYWDFYVGFPFVRMAIGEGELCVSCHAARNQVHADVETSATYGWASNRPFSHPVGEALGANGQGYDVAAPLDVNGATQAVGDGNATNDLVLSPTGKVTCVSCHAAHNADSNSQTVDAR